MAKRPPKSRTTLAVPRTAGEAGSADFRAILIVVGVSGSGKTTVATALAQRLGLPFEEGDRLHPPPKMHSAHPLDDREQWSWLEKIAAWIDDRRQLGTGGVITCPALRRSHRDFLTLGQPDVYIVYLDGERALIASRLAAHEDEHFTLPGLLDHYFAILEEPEPDEDPILIDVSRSAEDIVAEILRNLTLSPVAVDRRTHPVRRTLAAGELRAQRDLYAHMNNQVLNLANQGVAVRSPSSREQFRTE